MLVPGAASSPSDVSKVFDIFRLVMVRQDCGFDPNLVDLFICRFLRNDRDEFSVSFQIITLFFEILYSLEGSNIPRFYWFLL